MINETQLVALLRSVFWFSCLWILCYWLFRRYRIDAFRHKLFVIRDALFDDAANGLLPFDHPAYGMMRQYINGLIRFAHRLNTTTVVFFIFVSMFGTNKSTAPGFSVKLSAACTTLPDEAREKILLVHHRVLYEVFAYVTYTSPVFLPLFLSMMLYQAVRHMTLYGAIRCRQAVEDFAKKAPGIGLVEKEAELYGGIG